MKIKSALTSFFLLAITVFAKSQTQVISDIAYLSEKDTGSYTIFSNSATTLAQVDKPLIVVEGWDPFNDVDASGVERLLDGQTGNYLSTQLQNEGYDIIVLNFNKGADYIQRNAFVLVKLIELVNAQKNGNEQLVVCGISMGGLVARYALKYMEQNNRVHDTRLYISYDSPHQGANIPVAYQVLMWHYSIRFSLFSYSGFYAPIFNAPATKQMLKYWVDPALNQNNRGKVNSISPSPLHIDFYHELNNLGYPNNCRKIAISNGNRNGSAQKKQNGQNLSQGDFLLQLNDNIAYSTYRQLFASKSTEDFTALYIKSIAGFFLVDHHYMYQSMPPLDICPGSTNPLTEQLANTLISVSGMVVTNNEKSCFIPTSSALDIDNVSLFHDINTDNDIMCKTPFDAIYAPSKNNFSHIDIPTVTSNWLFNEITSSTTVVSNYLNLAGNSSGIINKDVEIVNGGALDVNTNNESDYIVKNGLYGNSQGIPEVGSVFYLQTSSCRPVNINVNAGSALTIGDGSRFGILTIMSGSNLILKQNSSLNVHYGSKIVIENGGKLVFESGAAIALYEQSFIEVKPGGKIEIAENATFTWSGKGYLKINTNTWGVSNIVATGPNAKFQKTGGGYGPFDEKLVEITGGGSLSVDKSLAEFKLQRGYVLMDEHTLLDVESKMRCYFVKFTTNNANKKHAGIMVYGQQNEAYLDNCIVENAGWGILMLNNSGNATQAKIVATKFINNEIGVYIQGKGADLSYCTFWRNTHAAIQLDMLTLPANLYKINAEGNGNGLLSNATNFSLINITDSKIYQNLSGVQVTGGTLTVGCSKIYNNYGPNLHIKNQTTLGLEPARWVKTGNNYFYNDFTTSIELNNAWSLYMDKGKNHFQVNPNYTSQVINGTLRSAGVWWQRLVFPIVAGQNYWNVNGTSPVMQTVSSSNDYLITQKYRTTTINIPIVDGSPFTTAPTFADCSLGNSLPYNPGDQPSAMIGKPNLTLSNGSDIKDYFMTGLDKLYIQNSYESAISIFELIVKHNYGTSNDIQLSDEEYISEQGLWSEVVYAAYEKMLEGLTSGIHTGVIGDYASDPDLYNKVRLVQEHLIGNMIAADTLAYEHWFKLSLDNAIIYKLMGDLNTCYNKLDNLKAVSFHTSTNANLVNYTFCRIENEINLRDSAITKMDYTIALKNCISELGYTYPTTTLNVGEEPADPIEEGYFGKKGNDANKSNAAPNQLADEQSTDEVNVYPNPSNGLIIVNANGVKVESVTIYNKLGMKVATYNNTDTINISQSGLFILEIKTDKGTYRKKVVVQ